jgi:predicted phage tail protein
MKRLVAVVGLVLVSLGLATPAMARSGSDSSHQHSYTLECVDSVPTFTNTGSGDILVQAPDGGGIFFQLGPGQSGVYDWEGDWEVAFEDPPGTFNLVVFDSGGPIECDDPPDDPVYSATMRLVCTEAIRITNDGTETIAGYGPTAGSRVEILPGESATVPWGRDPNGNMLDFSTAEAYTINADGSETLFDWGTFALTDYRAVCAEKTYTYTAVPVCVGDFPHVRFTATGTGDVYIAQNTHSAGLAKAGGPPITLPWDEHQAIPFPETDWDAIRTDTNAVFDSGSFTLADDNPCVSVPGAPTGLKLTPGNGSVTATWTAPSNNGGSAITGYRFAISPDGTHWTTLTHGTTTSRTVNGLKNGTRYYVKVQAVNTAGNSAFSTVANTIPRTKPTAPRALAATPGNGRVVLKWLAPSSNGGAAVTDYIIQRRIGTGAWATVNDGAGTQLTRTVIGLTNGTTYQFRVLAKNSAGTSPVSNTVNTIPRTVPSAPRSLTATPDNGRVTLKWLAPASNGGAAVTDFVIQRSSNGTNGWVTVNDGVRTATSYTVTGLTNGTRYYFRVLAKNAAGNSTWSTAANTIPRTVPSAPRSLTAAPTNVSGQIRLSWSLPATNGGSAITDYIVQRSPNGTSSWVTINDGVRTTTNHTVSGLTNGARYHFRVLAKNAAGTGATSNTVNQVPRTVPSAPVLRASAGNARVTLSWTPPTSIGGSPISRYVLQRSTSATSGWTNLSTSIPATSRSYTATGLTNGRRYYFRLSAINAAGTGAWSAPTSAVPAAPRVVVPSPPPPPPPPSSVYYPNCDAVRAAGKAPLLAGQPGYRSGLDRDGDGVACE